MGGFAIRAFLSMFRSSKRMPGRSWKTEWVRRTLRLLFEQASERSVAWSRAQLDNVPVSRKLMRSVQTKQLELSGVRCLQVIPKQVATDGLIVYLHGGAYVTGSPRSYLPLLGQIALDCRSRIIAPNYRLSPEHPFPAAQEDCVSVVSELCESAEEATFIVMGDSAGGGLAISTALAMQDNMPRKPDALVLISPWVEPTAAGGTMLSNDANDIFSKPFLDQCYAAHMQGADLHDSRVNFSNADVAGLPPCYVQWGDGELFHDQINSFVQRALAQGVQIEKDVFVAQFHVFQAMVPLLEESAPAIGKIADFCSRIFPPRKL